jgi:hypothetical protein
LAILDPSGTLVWEIGVETHTESTQLEKTGNRVLVKVPDKQAKSPTLERTLGALAYD